MSHFRQFLEIYKCVVLSLNLPPSNLLYSDPLLIELPCIGPKQNGQINGVTGSKRSFANENYCLNFWLATVFEHCI